MDTKKQQRGIIDIYTSILVISLVMLIISVLIYQHRRDSLSIMINECVGKQVEYKWLEMFNEQDISHPTTAPYLMLFLSACNTCMEEVQYWNTYAERTGVKIIGISLSPPNAIKYDNNMINNIDIYYATIPSARTYLLYEEAPQIHVLSDNTIVASYIRPMYRKKYIRAINRLVNQ